MSLDVEFNLGSVYQTSNPFSHNNQRHLFDGDSVDELDLGDEIPTKKPTTVSDIERGGVSDDNKSDGDLFDNLSSLKGISGFENIDQHLVQSTSPSRHEYHMHPEMDPTGMYASIPSPLATALAANGDDRRQRFAELKPRKSVKFNDSHVNISPSHASAKPTEEKSKFRPQQEFRRLARKYLFQPISAIPDSDETDQRIREAQTILILLSTIINTLLIPVYLHDWPSSSYAVSFVSIALLWVTYLFNRLPLHQKFCTPITIMIVGLSVLMLEIQHFSETGEEGEFPLFALNILVALAVSSVGYQLKTHLLICCGFCVVFTLCPMIFHPISGLKAVNMMMAIILMTVVTSGMVFMWEQHREMVSQEVKRTIELQDQFLANSSHEVRTPLTGVLGFIEILLNDDTLRKDQRTNLKFCQSSAKNMLVVVNDIVDYSKIEAGKFRLQEAPFEIRTLVLEILHIMAALADPPERLELSCSVDADVPVKLKGDAVRLRQIIVNLFGNGVKFTKAGSVRLTVTTHEKSSDGKTTLKFSVKDTGIGISQDQVSRLFKRFSQVDQSSTRRYGGAGLGLVICEKLTTLFEGEIQAVSKPGKGSEFWFTARLAIADDEIEDQPPLFEKFVVQSKISTPEPHHRPVRMKHRMIDDYSTKTRVLVVDDAKVNRKIITKLSESFGYACIQAVNGEQAVNIFKEHGMGYFSLILMDIQMPVKDGLVATQEIRAFEQNQKSHEEGSAPSRTPIIAITANAFDRDQDICLASGMDDYLSKPFTKNGLHAVMEKWLQAQNVSKSLSQHTREPSEIKSFN